MPQAIIVTEENVHDIIDYAKTERFDLSHLHDSIQYNLPERTVLIMDGSHRKFNLTFTDTSEDSFLENWKFMKLDFKPIEPV